MRKECTLNVLKKAMKNNDYSYDIYFRMAIIDEYLNGILDVWKLYDKLQITRCKQISIIPREMMNHKNEFIKLICSIKKDGFDFLNPILINKDGLIIDGAHRMVCAVYFNIPLISTYTTEETFNIVPNDYCKLLKINSSVDYGISFLYNEVYEATEKFSGLMYNIDKSDKYYQEELNYLKKKITQTRLLKILRTYILKMHSDNEFLKYYNMNNYLSVYNMTKEVANVKRLTPGVYYDSIYFGNK